MKYIRKMFLLGIILTIVIFNGKTLATEEFKAIEKSKEYEKWENLSEEERKDTIQPPYQTINFKDGVKRSKYNNLLSLRETILPTKYSMKEELANIKVKNQKATGACWAFSFTSVLETTYLKNLQIDREYSPMHIELKTAKMFKRDIDSGGNVLLAVAYSTSGNGPVLESYMPMSSVYNDEENDYINDVENLDLNKTITGQVVETKEFPSIYKTYNDSQVTYTDGTSGEDATYTQEKVNAMRNAIKQFIKQYGAITACLYSDITMDREGAIISDYYNPDESAYYCNDSTKTPNHAVTIVGWDDDFETTKFKENKQPAKKGAYIVLNSYGSEFGENGYMYVSYDDFAIENLLVGIESLKENIEYDNIYQYDELGANFSIGTGNKDIYSANIFTRDTSKEDMDEYLDEVGIYLLGAEGVEVYLSENGDLSNLKQVAAPGVLEPGYHNIKLPSPQKLNQEKFAVVIKYTNEEGAFIPLECNLYDSGATFISSNIYSTASANKGESEFSVDGRTWQEINDTKIDMFITLQNTNNCIKAFTTYQEKPPITHVTGVEIEEESITINKGSTASIVAKVKPDDATNKNVTWSSLDEGIVTVSNGVIKGEKAGTTTVTVTTEDGNRTDSINVIVVETEEPPKIVNVTGVKININLEEGVALNIKAGETYTVNAVVEPASATNKNVFWESSNENVATVQNGVITGVSVGTATITVTTEDGDKTDSIDVSIEENNSVIKVESVALNKTSLKLEVGDTANLVATLNPTNASNKNVIWTSSNESVATVSETGIIKALSKGKTTITVTTEDGNKKASCELTVTEKTNSDDDIYKSDNDNINNNTNKPDNTAATDKLPDTGVRVILIVVGMAIILIGTISFIKYRKYMEVK